MIIVKLIGGLGNQLFQYATARAIAERSNVELKIDKSPFINYKLHKYSLLHFNIKENIATKKDIAACGGFKDRENLKNLIYRLINSKDGEYYKEKNFSFDKDVLDLTGNIYLDGYWQSEKYFKDIRDILLKEISVKNEQEGRDLEIAKMIKESQSISLHVRRTDYVANNNYGTCDLNYYRRCIEEISKTKTNPCFFVFSDDHKWVKENLKFDYETVFVDHNDADRNFEDLRLMSQCEDNIIANSTFSWWGAWLNDNSEKRVLMPSRWFTDETIDTKDIYPEKWEKV